MKNFFIVICVLFCISHSVYAQLPIIKLSTENDLSSEFSDGHFQLDDTISCDAEIRYRGASSLQKVKKSFAIKLKDEKGDKLDVSLLNMRSDNSWILDAMAVDVSRMRNRVSMDLWNDFASESYLIQKNKDAFNGTHGKFVEVYLNEEYWGIYSLTEKIDRKQLKLKKFEGDKIKGVLYKSNSWSTLYSKDENYYYYDNTKGTWNGWEMSYPNVEDGEPINWKPLSDIIHWLSFSDTKEINNLLSSKIDIPVWVDYFLMMDLLCAQDNICKNQYVYFYDVSKDDIRLGVVPWDMDHSWGRGHKGTSTDIISPTIVNDMTINNICDILVNKYHELDKNFNDRYAELRQTYFSSNSLKQRFNDYFTLFTNTGAADREKIRWSGIDGITLDFQKEQIYINQWIDKRLESMDKKYDYKDCSDISMPVFSKKEQNKIYNIQGQCVRNISKINHLEKNIIITNGKKHFLP